MRGEKGTGRIKGGEREEIETFSTRKVRREGHTGRVVPCVPKRSVIGTTVQHGDSVGLKVEYNQLHNGLCKYSHDIKDTKLQTRTLQTTSQTTIKIK